MQIVLIILVNVLMWAIFYFIISLKLEKSASEFREKKLRKEMDDIIREFNLTAERNISLLENRIKAIKRLLAADNSVKGFDRVVGDDTVDYQQKSSEEYPDHNKGNINKRSSYLQAKQEFLDDSYRSLPLKKSLLKRCQNVIKIAAVYIGRKFQEMAAEDRHSYAARKTVKGADEVPVLPESEASTKNIISRDFSSVFPDNEVSGDSIARKESNESSPVVYNQEKMKERFSGVKDRFVLVEEMSKSGYTAEDISRFSGIPSGEVKLIINLCR